MVELASIQLSGVGLKMVRDQAEKEALKEMNGE